MSLRVDLVCVQLLAAIPQGWMEPSHRAGWRGSSLGTFSNKSSSSEGGFILRAQREMQRLWLHSSGVSRAAPAMQLQPCMPACCSTVIVLCLQPGCAGMWHHVLFPPVVFQLLASRAEQRALGAGFLQLAACLRIRFCSAVGCRTGQALSGDSSTEACVHQALQKTRSEGALCFDTRVVEGIWSYWFPAQPLEVSLLLLLHILHKTLLCACRSSFETTHSLLKSDCCDTCVYKAKNFLSQVKFC